MNTSLRTEEKDETARNYPATLLPEMSLRKALGSRFRLDQITYTVSTCPGNIFKRFVSECGQVSRKNNHWRPIQQENLLRLLETDCSDVARWYSINVLLEHKVAVPLEVN